MTYSVVVRSARWRRPGLWRRARYGLAGALCACMLLACAGVSTAPRAVSELPPLQLNQGSLQVAAAASLAPTPDLLAVDPSMRAFVQRYTGGVRSARQRLMLLHRALIGGGLLDLQYDPAADGTAREVFRRGTANCLSYANLFVALAREAGLDAAYQWLEMRPQWSRSGARVMVRLHVNVTVDLGSGGRYMVDIDPAPSRDVSGSRAISDSDAQALYHNNIAMQALAVEDLATAWPHAVRALQLSPRLPHLWLNLGAIYRLAGQHHTAESLYLYALELEPQNRSAMNNLVVLYAMEGRDADRRYWEARIEHYRDANPYYHAWLGDLAGEQGDWRGALKHYRDALQRLPGDSNLLYSTGLIHYRLNDLAAAAAYIRRAMEAATLRSEIDTYRLQLQALRHGRLAAVGSS
ncbi:MAG: tetratricopeptide repeat protein [Halioglobus sp.]|nr:tetratricopeptide repeat protein [Halioglobus sp.]